MYQLFVDDNRTPNMCVDLMTGFLDRFNAEVLYSIKHTKLNNRHFKTQRTNLKKTFDAVKRIEKSTGISTNFRWWVIVRNYQEFVACIEDNGLPRLISFDHDLGKKKGQEEMRGIDCVKWLVNYCQDHDLKIPEYLVHSQNNVGSDNIDNYLNNYKNFIKNKC